MITGRPRKELDFPQFEKLCAICATEEEIAHWFDMTVDTLSARCKENYGETFSEVYKKFSSEGKMSIRRKQIEVAMSGNVSMLIWVGKQTLGQKDRQETEFSGPGGIPLVPPTIDVNFISPVPAPV